MMWLVIIFASVIICGLGLNEKRRQYKIRENQEKRYANWKRNNDKQLDIVIKHIENCIEVSELYFHEFPNDIHYTAELENAKFSLEKVKQCKLDPTTNVTVDPVSSYHFMEYRKWTNEYKNMCLKNFRNEITSEEYLEYCKNHPTNRSQSYTWEE